MNSTPTSSADCFVLLDDGDGLGCFYTLLIACIECRAVTALPDFFAQLEQALAAGQHAIGLFTYELGAAMHGIAARPAQAPVLASMLLFKHCEQLNNVDAWLKLNMEDTPFGITHLSPGVDETEYCRNVETIQRYIEAGDTYQANLTFPLHLQTYGDPLALYAALRARQPVPYGAFIKLPDGRHILSFSPELFVSHKQGTLTAKPMKGTAAASDDVAKNSRRAVKLAADTKERSENLMIVDLLRNDLGRTCRIGSVRVPELFSLESYPNVHHLVSSVTGELADDRDALDLIAGSFPGGSITGAPKIRAMQIIDELEPTRRGLYCGSLLYLDVRGEMDSSIAIRSLLVKDGQVCCWGGGGIVADSEWQAEYQESITKVKVLLDTLQNL